MQEHPLIELYVSLNDKQLNTLIEQQLASVDLDTIILRTLAAAGVTQQVMLTLLVTDDEGIREMNQQYREQDKPTDVLSFPLLDQPLVQAPADQIWEPKPPEDETAAQQPAFVPPPNGVTNLGDIVMSWPTLTRQASEAGHAALTELLYLLSHG